MNKPRNKVQYNLRNVHYALMNTDEGGVITYAAPVPIPGAVSLSVTPEGDISEFYADGILYHTAEANGGYSGTASVAQLPREFKTDVMGEELSTNDKILVEKASAPTKAFALLFEFEGDRRAVRRALLNCTAKRTTIEGETTQKGITVKPQQLSFRAAPNLQGLVKTETTEDTPDAVYNEWYKKVWTEDGGAIT